MKDKIKSVASLAEGLFKQLQEKSEGLPLRQSLESLVESIGMQVVEKAGFAQQIPLKIKRLSHFKGELPQYKTTGSSGLDVRACFAEGVESIKIPAGERALVPTGLAMKVAEAYEIQVRPRSGLALKQGISLPNTPGTIDSDYRGEVQIIMINLGQEEVEIKDGDRIAQLVICPVVKARIEVVDNLDETERGEGGFGSTGLN